MVEYYERNTFTDQQVPLKLFYHQYVNGKLFTINHWHDSVEINYIIKGRAVQILDGNSVISEAGDLCIINTGVIHSNYSENDQKEIEAITLQISYSFLEKWFFKDVYLNVPDDKKVCVEIQAVLKKMIQERMEDEKYVHLRIMEDLFHLLTLLGPYCGRNEQMRTERKGIRQFKLILDYIEKNYMEELRLEDLAERFSYSPSYLSRMFRKYCNSSFHGYLQSVRLKETMDDMRKNPDKSVLRYSEDNGFPNLKAMIRVFREECGCTPSQWMKREMNRDSSFISFEYSSDADLI